MSKPSSAGGRAQWMYVGLAAFIAAIWFAVLAGRPLFDPDEGRYAEIPREMLATHDWIVPHLDGLAYVEKPPLQYWATAAALRLLGHTEFAARFYTALCALATVLAVWLAADRLWGRPSAWRAAAALCSMLLFVVLGQLLTLDMSLTFYMTLSLTCFLMAQLAVSPSPQRGWMLAAWVATALGVLTKGLVAAVIPAAVLALYSLYARDYSPWRRLSAGVGLPLFLAVSVPWYWLAALRQPGFLEFFFVHEHVSRYLTPSANREQAWWFFGAVFVLGSMPWTLPALRAVATGWRRGAPRGRFDPVLFVWIWVVFIGVFFSLSDSKLIPYVLPAMPGLALLMAASPADIFARDLNWTAILTVLAALALAAAGIYGPRFLAVTDRNHYFALLARPAGEVAALLALSGVFVLLQLRRDSHGAVFLGVGWCLAGLMLMRAAAVAAPIYSGVVLARALPSIPAGLPLYSVATYVQTLPFYWQRNFKLVAYRGELDFGLRREPAAEIPRVADFLVEWRAIEGGYAVMERSMYDDLKSSGVPMREVTQDVHHVLVARR